MPFAKLNFNKLNVLVVGDVMLDQYWYGQATRISPEAPVPVVKLADDDNRPGGAANVAANAASLGANVTLLGIVGDDEQANILTQTLAKYPNITTHWVRSKAYPTITKLRVLSHYQQLIRLDTEKMYPAEDSAHVFIQYLKLLDNADVVILSDYAKGSMTDPSAFIREAKKRHKPVLVDPKHVDLALYKEATVMTPNVKELEGLTQMNCQTQEAIEQAAKTVLDNAHIDILFVTKGKEGLSVFSQKEQPVHIPSAANEVYDVTGAGDTVITVFALGMAQGMSVALAAQMANTAAGIVVSKVGTSTVSVKELSHALATQRKIPQGVMAEPGLLSFIEIAKARGEKIVFTNGCFDILHRGHVAYLEKAKALGDRLVVAVNSDASVKRLKGEARPVNHQRDRMHMLASLRSVDWVVIFEEDTPQRIIEALTPDILVKGGDYHNNSNIVGAEFVKKNGGQVHIIRHDFEHCSTTKLIGAMQE